jgi:hypothetical protein
MGKAKNTVETSEALGALFLPLHGDEADVPLWPEGPEAAAGEVVGVVVRGVPASVQGIALRYPGAQLIPEPVHLWMTSASDRLAHPEPARTSGMAVDSSGQLVYTKPAADINEDLAAVPLPMLDKLIEATATQLRILRQLRAASENLRREHVTLQTPTGALEYALPLSLDDTYSSAAVSKILSPTGKGHRSIAQHRRRSHDLLGIKIGNQYRYPKFQIDAARHEIRPVVAYANRRLESDADPWGTLDWWYSEDEALNHRRPVDMVDTGELTEKHVDFAIELSQQGMD